MQEISKYCKLANKYISLANNEKPNQKQKCVPKIAFSICYISEAHAIDGWKLKQNKINFKNHRYLKERKEAYYMLYKHMQTQNMSQNNNNNNNNNDYIFNENFFTVTFISYIYYCGIIIPTKPHYIQSAL